MIHQLIIYVLKCLSKPILKKKIIVYSGANFGYTSHSKDVFEFLSDLYGERNLIFISRIKSKKGLHLYSLKGLLYMLLSKNYAITVTMPAFVNTKNKTIVQLWHGIPIKGLGVNDITMDKLLLNRLIVEFNSYSAIVSPSNIYTDVIKRSFLVKNNDLFKIAPTPTIIKLIEKETINKSTKQDIQILYAPTFRTSTSRNWDLAENQHFKISLNSTNYKFVVLYHPKDPKYELPTQPILETLAESDIVITDYSSIVFDAVLLNKKVILYTQDFEEYSQSRGFAGVNIYNVIKPISDITKVISEIKKIDSVENVNELKAKLFESTDKQSLTKIFTDIYKIDVL